MKKKTAYRIEIELTGCHDDGGGYGRKWTSRIVRIRGGKTIWSSGSQRYSRHVDCFREARKFLEAARKGLVEVKL